MVDYRHHHSHTSHLFFLFHSNINICTDSILKSHVLEVLERLKTQSSDPSYETEQSGVCPHHADEHRSMFEMLHRDDRATEELVENQIMALFRTGIDSVSVPLINTYKQNKHELKQSVFSIVSISISIIDRNISLLSNTGKYLV